MSKPLLILPILLLAACMTAPAGPPTQPNDREWNLLMADYQWLETNRKAQPAPPATASRKQAIELLLENHRKIQPLYENFSTKLDEYYRRTSDPRAAAVMAREKVTIGDEYMNALSRYDTALTYYRQALQYDPNNAEAKDRIALAEKRRYVSMEAFANVKKDMKEDDVRRLVGLPREDWIKQVVQNNRVYSVWIYPKADGGASAVYFDNGVVYHTNWNAAAPGAPAQTSK
jgi:tetratricopeptide (TPR) repeat protein